MKSDRKFGFARHALPVALLAMAQLASAGGEPGERPSRAATQIEIPHSMNLDLDFRARKRGHRAGNIEPSQLLDPAAGMSPVVWPRNSDMRARLLTPGLRSTPVVGWIAANLYRSRNDSGWCLEVDPGEGQYVVFYRLNLK